MEVVFCQNEQIYLQVVFLYNKQTKCTNLSKFLFWNWNSTCFGQLLFHREFFTEHTANVHIIQVCWELEGRSTCSSHKLSANIYEI